MVIDNYCFHKQELACVFRKRFLYLLFPLTLLKIFILASWICICMAILLTNGEVSWQLIWTLTATALSPTFQWPVTRSQEMNQQKTGYILQKKEKKKKKLKKEIKTKIFHCQSLELLSPLYLTLYHINSNFYSVSKTGENITTCGVYFCENINIEYSLI